MRPILPLKSDFPPALRQVKVWPTFLAFTFDWAVIAFAIGMAHYFPGWLTFILAQVAIASRQHALFLLMHEGSHFLLLPSKPWNDRLSNLLAAWPVGMSTQTYRVRHWKHHRFLNSNLDPDWARKMGHPAWTYPTSPWGFWKNSLPYFFGRGFLEMAYALRSIGPSPRELPAFLAFYGLVITAVTLAGGWKMLVLYWLLPYFTLLPFMHRLRYSAEHLALPKTNVLDNTRNVLAGPIESFLFAPHCASLHLVHHLYPFVPWHQLRQARAFLGEKFAQEAYENKSYFIQPGSSAYGDLVGMKNLESRLKRKSAA